MIKYLFFRNDDVRQTLDDSLIKLTNAFIESNIPLTHAVEPANITSNVISWLIELKNKYPNLIEIIQHGYNHKLNVETKIGGKIRKGEFGGTRTYKDQYIDILAGKELMDKYFGDLWFPAFTFPYGGRNEAAIQATSDAGFKVINSGYNPSLKYKIFYTIGHLLRKKILFNRRISYNLTKVPGTNLIEIDIGFGFISNYLDEDVNSELRSIDTMKSKLKRFENEHAIGILTHHRYHNTDEKIILVKEFLSYCKENEYSFIRQEDLYNNLQIK